MSKLENVCWNIVAGLLTMVLLSGIGTVIGFFRSLSLDIKLLSIVILLLFMLLLLNLRILWTAHRIAFPKKPPLVRAHSEPDTFLFLHGQWRKIPDWQTRDYLAHVLGFRPGEEDITLKPKDYVDKLQKGPPLESILTYARKSV